MQVSVGFLNSTSDQKIEVPDTLGKKHKPLRDLSSVALITISAPEYITAATSHSQVPID